MATERYCIGPLLSSTGGRGGAGGGGEERERIKLRESGWDSTLTGPSLYVCHSWLVQKAFSSEVKDGELEVGQVGEMLGDVQRPQCD